MYYSSPRDLKEALDHWFDAKYEQKVNGVDDGRVEDAAHKLIQVIGEFAENELPRYIRRGKARGGTSDWDILFR